MAIKAGNVVHVGNDTVLIDRIQTGGPGQVNIKRDTVREVGNYLSVGQVTDTPDLSFSLESWDVSVALEALLTGHDPTTTPGANTYDLAAALPLNIKSAFKGGASAASPYVTVESVAVPYLILESMSYRFGMKSDAAQTATLKGDSIFYNPGSTYCESSTGLGSISTTFTVTNKALTTNVATLTIGAHTLVAGMIVTVTGVDSTFNGTYTLTSVTGTEILYALTHANVISVAASGSVVQAGQIVVTAHAAYAVTEGGVQRRTLSVGTNVGRLNFGTDYTETYGSTTAGAATTTVHVLTPVATTDTLRIMYASPTAESFAQSVHATVEGTAATLNTGTSPTDTTMVVDGDALFVVGQLVIIDDGAAAVELRKITVVSGTLGAQTLTVAALTNAHSTGATVAEYVPSIKPASIRGRDIDVYIDGTKKISVQSVDVDWKVTLQPDEEFGNYHYVDQDFETPDVTGTIQFKPRTAQEMLALMQQLAATPDALESAAATTSEALEVQIVLKNPVDGRPLKVLKIADARFDLPGYSARVLQKLTFDAKFTSDTGSLKIRDYLNLSA